MQKNSALVQSSRYVSGGKAEVNKSAIEWWERTSFPLSSDDDFYTVEPRFAGRLDQIAALFYDDSRKWWLIAQYNGILDAYAEIVPGRILRIPKKDRLASMMTGSLGGYPSARELPDTSVLPIV